MFSKLMSVSLEKNHQHLGFQPQDDLFKIRTRSLHVVLKLQGLLEGNLTLVRSDLEAYREFFLNLAFSPASAPDSITIDFTKELIKRHRTEFAKKKSVRLDTFVKRLVPMLQRVRSVFLEEAIIEYTQRDRQKEINIVLDALASIPAQEVPKESN